MKKKLLALILAISLAIPSVPQARMQTVTAAENEVVYQYTFHFETNGGTALDDYIIRSDVSEVWVLPTTTRTGWVFDGWYLDENLETKFDLYNCNLTEVYPNGTVIPLYAKWREKDSPSGQVYTITYMLNGGQFLTNHYPTTFQSGDTIVFPVPVKEGYEFDGWYVDESLTTVLNNSMVQDLVLYAKWVEGETITYPITYVLNGGTNPADAPTELKNGVVTEFPTPYREGYMFKGWFLDESLMVALGTFQIAGPITLYAKWEENPVVAPTPPPSTSIGINYVLNGGENPSNAMTSVPPNGTVIAPTPTRYGYNFVGWYYDKDFTYDFYSYFDTKFVNEGKERGVVTLYAKWELAVYTVRYHSNGGSLSEPFTDVYTMITGLNTLKETSRPGYQFMGWYSDTSFTNKVTSIAVGNAGDIDLYALWSYVGTQPATPNTPAQTNPNNPTTDNPTPGVSGAESGTEVDEEQQSQQVTKIVYKGVALANVTHNNPSEVRHGETIELLPPQRKDYKFLGWTDVDGNYITSIHSNGEEEIYVYAEWEHIKLGVSLSVTNVKSKTLKFSWKSTKYAEGVQIQYATNKKFKNAKKVTYKYSKCKVAKRTYKIKKLKKKKTYYVRFRQYATDSRGKKIYGNWLKTGKIKIWR